ncbi:MAG: HAD-IIIA family hydrolase [Phycisphaerae bacterium]|nr:HAD-IIIA family hydrolase [Phycisphaerae bacterium]
METSSRIDPAHGGAASRVRLLVLDVDGVLTDGGIALSDRGEETKRFHVRDGCGLRMWQALGLHVAIITGRSGMSLRHRVEELGIRHVINGSKRKGYDLRTLCERLGLEPSQSAMLGDDLPDLPALRACGYPMAVRDAAAEVRAIARFETTHPGGHGAVRDAIEHLLHAQGRWADAVALYDAGDEPTAATGRAR